MKESKAIRLYSLQRVYHVLSSPSATIAAALSTHEAKQATSKNVGEDIIHTTTASTTFPQALLPITVVQFLLLWIGQHLIGKADFLKLSHKVDIGRHFKK